jgi:hypothetical protein
VLDMNRQYVDMTRSFAATSHTPVCTQHTALFWLFCMLCTRCSGSLGEDREVALLIGNKRCAFLLFPLHSFFLYWRIYGEE